MLLSVKLKNLVLKASEGKNIEPEFHLENIPINGVKKGCSGFVKNKNNGSVVYVTTEPESNGITRNYMYRYADNISDFTGYHNRWVDSPEVLAEEICNLLKVPVSQARDIRI